MDAVYKALDQLVGVGTTLTDYTVQAVTQGIDALGEVTVRLQSDKPASSLHPQSETGAARSYLGHGADTDIIVASAKAYLAALNKLVRAEFGVADTSQSEAVRTVA